LADLEREKIEAAEPEGEEEKKEGESGEHNGH
jgi:hypothetical protein